MKYMNYPTLFRFIFVTLNEEQQVDYLKYLYSNNRLDFEMFLPMILTPMMEPKSSLIWADFLENLDENILLSPSLITICANTCPDDWIKDLYEQMLDKGVMASARLLLKAIVNLGKRNDIIPSLLEVNNEVVLFLDYETNYKLLNLEIELKKGDALNGGILNTIMENEEMNSFWEYIEECILSFKDRKEEENPPTLYTVFTEMKDRGGSIGSPEELEGILGQCKVDFVIFINCVPFEVLDTDANNGRILLQYALKKLEGKENVNCLVSLLETSCKYRAYGNIMEMYVAAVNNLPDLSQILLSDNILSSEAAGMFSKILIDRKIISAESERNVSTLCETY